MLLSSDLDRQAHVRDRHSVYVYPGGYGTHHPITPPSPFNHIMDFGNRGLFIRAGPWRNGQPSVMVRSHKLRYVPIFWPVPVGKLRFPPRSCGSVLLRVVEFREIRVDRTKMIMNPGESKLNHKIRRHNNEFWMLDLALDNTPNCRIFNKQLEAISRPPGLSSTVHTISSSIFT